MNIQKAAVRASNNAMRGYIPHNAIVSQGAKIAARLDVCKQYRQRD